MNRVTKTTTADGSIATNSYSGNTATFQDQAGAKRQTTSDAMGRVTQVIEDPGASPHFNYTTSYVYDVLDDLGTVTQGSQTRTFGYDSRAMLAFAINPESGTAYYSYDPDGNLKTRIDNRGIASTYSYDVLNRPTLTSYADGTPTVGYTQLQLPRFRIRAEYTPRANGAHGVTTSCLLIRTGVRPRLHFPSRAPRVQYGFGRPIPGILAVGHGSLRTSPRRPADILLLAGMTSADIGIWTTGRASLANMLTPSGRPVTPEAAQGKPSEFSVWIHEHPGAVITGGLIVVGGTIIILTGGGAAPILIPIVF